MQHELDYNAIVILGNWNLSIFSEEWVRKYVMTEETEIAVEIPLQPDNSLRFSTSDFRFFISGMKLCFSVLNTKDDTYEKIIRYAIRTLEVLQHTPITAFGINFNLKISETQKVEHIFKLGDSEPIFHAFKLRETNITRVLELPDLSCVLNLIFINSNEQTVVRFNYHSVATSISEFKEKFDANTFFRKREHTFELLKNVYGLTLS